MERGKGGRYCLQARFSLRLRDTSGNEAAARMDAVVCASAYRRSQGESQRDRTEDTVGAALRACPEKSEKVPGAKR